MSSINELQYIKWIKETISLNTVFIYNCVYKNSRISPGFFLFKNYDFYGTLVSPSRGVLSSTIELFIDWETCTYIWSISYPRCFAKFDQLFFRYPTSLSGNFFHLNLVCYVILIHLWQNEKGSNNRMYMDFYKAVR